MIVRVCSCAVVAACLGISSALAGPIETIGPFDILAVPSSATASVPIQPPPPISPVQVFATGLNTSDFNDVGFDQVANEAFTGTPLLDDGILNLRSGEFIELVFDAPIVNDASSELVIFQLDTAPNSPSGTSSLAVSTDIDSFVTETTIDVSEFEALPELGLLINSLTPPLGSQAGQNGTVAAATVDLSALGVPLNGSVSTIRLVSVDSDIDLLGVGVIPEPTTLTLVGLTLAGMAFRRSR